MARPGPAKAEAEAEAEARLVDGFGGRRRGIVDRVEPLDDVVLAPRRRGDDLGGCLENKEK